MRQKPGAQKPSAEKVVKDIRRRTRKQHSAEEKIRIVLEGLRGDVCDSAHWGYVISGGVTVTYADGSHVKSWVVRDSKVTSEPQKGYYFFWVEQNGQKLYVQTPIARTYIEEIP